MRVAALLCALSLGLSACAPERDDTAPAPLPESEVTVAKIEKSAAQPAVIGLSVEELAKAQEQGDVRVIDVRRDDEVANGMIPGAEHIAMESFDPAAVTAGDDRPIILYCRSGRRSGIVAEKLAAYTGKPVPHLADGFNAWVDAGKETVIPR